MPGTGLGVKVLCEQKGHSMESRGGKTSHKESNLLITECYEEIGGESQQWGVPWLGGGGRSLQGKTLQPKTGKWPAGSGRHRTEEKSINHKTLPLRIDRNEGGAENFEDLPEHSNQPAAKSWTHF